MEIRIANECDIDGWMNLVCKVKDSFPGLETKEALDEHRDTVLGFIYKESAICARIEDKIIGVLIKIINIISGFIVQQRFVAVHTILNKVTGAMLFVLPFSVSFVDRRYSGSVICAVATFAAIQEGHLIRTKRTQ